MSSQIHSDHSGLDGPTAQLFKLEGPLLSDGRGDTPLFTTDLMWAHLKIYARGGENDLHAHPEEEHTFIVLQGEATFVDADDVETVLSPYEGILLPKGTYYRFRSTGDENLVMLRIGVGSNSRLPGKEDERKGPDGQPMRGNPSQVARGRLRPVPSGTVFRYRPPAPSGDR
jgi:mannose-6-phosphate isomerase-like protein (cupin superfamily)